jgi:enoyl-CoA hydratase/carnithine racemase
MAHVNGESVTQYGDIQLAISGAVSTITITRPSRLNALRPQSLVEMAMALEESNRDQRVRVVVLTGAGERAFCAGGDLESVGDEDTRRSGSGAEEIRRWINAFRQCSKPIIAKVRGYCLGLGNEVNLLCDITVAGESARFGQAGPKVGSAPIVGGTQLLPLVCGFKRAKEILFFCRRYSGEEALRMGLTNAVVPDDQLDAEVERWANELISMSPQSLRIGKQSLSYMFDIQWPSLEHNLEIMGWMVGSEQMQEGAAAFLEKRSPDWSERESSEPDAAAFISRHIRALLARDLDAAMRDYDDSSVLVVPGAELRGVGEIRDYLEHELAKSPQQSHMEYSIETSEDGVSLTWKLFESLGGDEISSGVDEFSVVDDSLIAAQRVVFE